MNLERLGEVGAEEQPITGGESAFEGDVADEFGFGSSNKGRRRIGEGTIVIVGALIIAAGALYGMRWLGRQTGRANTDASLEARVVAFLEGFSDEKGETKSVLSEGVNARAIIDRLADDRTDKQVPLDEVKKNPFLRPQENSSDMIQNQSEPIDPAEEARRARERRYAQLESHAQMLIVSSIMGSAQSRVAVVEDEVVQVGDELEVADGVLFRVVRIDPFEVHLEADDFRFMISLEQ